MILVTGKIVLDSKDAENLKNRMGYVTRLDLAFRTKPVEGDPHTRLTVRWGIVDVFQLRPLNPIVEDVVYDELNTEKVAEVMHDLANRCESISVEVYDLSVPVFEASLVRDTMTPDKKGLYIKR